MKRATNLAPDQIKEERDYLIAERLGILCGSNEPTAAQLKIATDEADAWELTVNYPEETR